MKRKRHSPKWVIRKLLTPNQPWQFPQRPAAMAAVVLLDVERVGQI